MVVDIENGNKNLGIITRKDQDILYVWTSRFPLNELKFPRWDYTYKEWFRLGNLVRVKITAKLDELQDPSNLEEEIELKERINIISEPHEKWDFSVKVHLSFPPVNFYDKELSAVKNYESCKAIAYSVQFGKVALFSDIQYAPTKFYKGFVTRIPFEKNWIAEKLGTLFMIIEDKNKPITEIMDPKLQEAIYQKLPWKESYILSTNEHGISNIADIKGHQLEQKQWSPKKVAWNEDDYENVNGFTTAINTGMDGNEEQNGLNADFREPNYCGSDQRPVISVVHGIESENQLFGNLVASKLQWVHERDPGTCVHLQKLIIELCGKYKLEMLEREKCQLRDKQQPLLSAHTNFSSSAYTNF